MQHIVTLEHRPLHRNIASYRNTVTLPFVWEGDAMALLDNHTEQDAFVTLIRTKTLY